MAKPLASFTVSGSYGPETVAIHASRAKGCAVAFQAPGYRALGFATLDRAKARAEKLHHFAGWAV